MNVKLDSTRSAAVSEGHYWISIDDQQPPAGVKLLLINERNGVAVLARREFDVLAEALPGEAEDTQALPQQGVIRRLKSRDGWSQRWDRMMSADIVAPPARLTPVEVEPGPLPPQELPWLADDIESDWARIAAPVATGDLAFVRTHTV
mgnify:CR=1 FL=1